MSPPSTLDDLRAYAVGRSLFPPTTLSAAIERLGFVQADPIRAPARAQDLILRPRVVGYRAGDLDRSSAELGVAEDHFINYGFLPKRHLELMLPRTARRPWDAQARKRSKVVLAFVRSRGEVHPREVDARFAHGTVTNDWGGTSNATTRLLEQMHYRGLVRVARREAGIRIYAARDDSAPESATLEPRDRARALLDLAVALYAPLPLATLGMLASGLGRAAPHLKAESRFALKRARADLPRASVDGVVWVWPQGEEPRDVAATRDRSSVRFLAPFDPVVWDRRRFELFWGWAYRFEAYTPVAKRKWGYYALPLLWKDEVVGWGNFAVRHGALEAELGYVSTDVPRRRGFKRALEEEIERMRSFLGL